MKSICLVGFCFVITTLWGSAVAWAQQVGSINGAVYDRDFDDAPIANARITINETGQTTTTSNGGFFTLSDVNPGTYTLVVRNSGYEREVLSNVLVRPGQVTEREIFLSGDFTVMDEFIVQELEFATGTQQQLLVERLEAVAQVDAIGKDLISQSGFGDVAGALSLVAGASVAQGKFAVVRGLPPRFVSTQINGVRLVSADRETRAVELDQIPTDAIQSIKVTKTFTPDQQGDASGGAVNVVLSGVPEKEFIFNIGVGAGYNTQSPQEGGFLTYDGGGVTTFGLDDKQRDIQQRFFEPTGLPGAGAFNPPKGGDGDPEGALGTAQGDLPLDYSWSVALGGRRELGDLTIGAFGTFFWDQGYSYFDNGINDDLRWIPQSPLIDDPAVPDIDSPSDTAFPDIREANAGNQFDVVEGTKEVQWGSLTTAGMRWKDQHSLDFALFQTRTASDTATLSEDTRTNQRLLPSLSDSSLDAFPSLPDTNEIPFPLVRNEALTYQERTVQTIQLRGEHTVPFPAFGPSGIFRLLSPKLDWTVAHNSATFDEPDKRFFEAAFQAEPTPDDPRTGWFAVPSGSTVQFGNVQRTFTKIRESGKQLSLNGTLPFEQWTGTEGSVKLGIFADRVERRFFQDTFQNLFEEQFLLSGADSSFNTDISERTRNNTIADTNGGVFFSPTFRDIDYTGEQNIDALYWMVDMPIAEWLRLVGGIRREKTDLSTALRPDVPTGGGDLGDPLIVTGDATTGRFVVNDLNLLRQTIGPDVGNASVQQTDFLPAISFNVTPLEGLSLRGSYTETLARQTFRELTPSVQEEFFGGDVFIGNPDLQIADVESYDIRVDYRPNADTFISASWFKKDITNTIENIGVVDENISFTVPVNFPRGEIRGVEFEARQNVGALWDRLDGLTIGGNFTLIDSEVQLPGFRSRNFTQETGVDIQSRDMTEAPAYLYNLNLSYNIEETDTQFSIFYSKRGDTLIRGPSFEPGGVFIPAVYRLGSGTLNLSISQKFWKDRIKLKFGAKNLTNPKRQTVWRQEGIADDVVRTSHTDGIDLSLSISAEFEF